jgi:hypothetical protein
MKRTKITSLIILVFCLNIHAQTVSIVNRYEILADKNTGKFFPVINKSGNKLLFTSDSYNGLSMYNFDTKTVNLFQLNRAGYEPFLNRTTRKYFFAQQVFKWTKI